MGYADLMAQVAFVINIPSYKTSSLGDFLREGSELVKLVQKGLPIDNGVTLDQIAVSDSTLVPLPFTALASASTSPKQARSGKVTTTTATIAGGAAGNLTVTGIKTTDRLVSVIKVDDTTHAGVDLTSEFTITAADTINNTGKTATTSCHVAVSYDRT